MSAAGLPSTTPRRVRRETSSWPSSSSPHRMRWQAKSDSVAVSADGASCSHECNSWDSACGDTWFSEGIVSIELLTDEVDRPSLYAGIVSRDHVFEEDTASKLPGWALLMTRALPSISSQTSTLLT